MEWRDEGFVLNRRAHGETAAIVSILTREHGRHAGLIHGGQGARKSGLLQIGSRLAVTWRGRLSEHLGTFEADPLATSIGYIIDDPGRLAALQSATSLLHMALPEREPYPELFAGFEALSDALTGAAWAHGYIFWEFAFLQSLGFSLDIGACAVTGVTENLTHVSPRSGRAVSESAAGAYRDRLLKLPPFLVGGPATSEQDLVDGLALTGHFLERHVTSTHNMPLPAARIRLMEICRAMAARSANEAT